MRILSQQVSRKQNMAQQSGVSPFDFALGLKSIQDVAAELGKLKERHNGEIDALMARAEQILKQTEAKAASRIQQIRLEHKGDKGDPGISPDPQRIIDEVTRRIRVPKDGETPIVDEKKIARMAASLIPKPKDGITPKINHDAIIERVFEQLDSGQRKLKIKHLEDFDKGLEQTIAPIRHLAAGFRGGGDTVVAGSNVTITTNTNGNKVIAASSSGVTALSSTETPNGIITVFTFAAATAQPSYIVSDSVWLKATSKAGTVNWTWNNGTKKATLTVPPQDDIFGIV